MFLKKITQKTIFHGDFNLNCLDYNKNLEIRTFYNRIFAHGCIPLITKPTRAASKTGSLIDNIFTNFIFGISMKLKKIIIKTDVSEHFPVFVSLCSDSLYTDLHNVNWNSINHSPETNWEY